MDSFSLNIVSLKVSYTLIPTLSSYLSINRMVSLILFKHLDRSLNEKERFNLLMTNLAKNTKLARHFPQKLVLETEFQINLNLPLTSVFSLILNYAYDSHHLARVACQTFLYLLVLMTLVYNP